MKKNKNYSLLKTYEEVEENVFLREIIQKSSVHDKPVIVKNKDNQVTGIITQSDLLKAILEGNNCA